LAVTNLLLGARKSIAFFRLSQPLYNIASSFPKRGIEKSKRLPTRIREDPSILKEAYGYE